MILKIRKHKFYIVSTITTILIFATTSFISIIVLMSLGFWDDVYSLYIFLFSLIVSILKTINHKIVIDDNNLIVPNLYFPVYKYTIELTTIVAVEKGIKKIATDNNALVVTIKTHEKIYYFRSNYFLLEDLQELLSYLEAIVHKNIGYSI